MKKLIELAEAIGYKVDRKKSTIYVHYSQHEDHHEVVDLLKRRKFIVQYYF